MGRALKYFEEEVNRKTSDTPFAGAPPSRRFRDSHDRIQILHTPLAGAFIGWLTNWIAIKLLFRPHNPIKFFGMKVQGIIPKEERK